MRYWDYLQAKEGKSGLCSSFDPMQIFFDLLIARMLALTECEKEPESRGKRKRESVVMERWLYAQKKPSSCKSIAFYGLT